MGLLAEIGTFGDVAAEDDDAVLSYFLKTDDVDEIENGSSFAVIGRKGSGKTAITKYFSQPQPNYVTASPTLRDYPWAEHAKRRNLGASDIEAYVSSWRYLIAVKANSIILEKRGMKQMTDAQRTAREFLNANYGGIVPSLAEIMRPARLKVTRRTFSPSVMGTSVGSIDIEDEKGGIAQEIDVVTQSLMKNAAELADQAGMEKICIHFDELDQGMSELTDDRRYMLIGLILAIRSIRGSKEGEKVFPVFYIRTDLWDEIRFSDKNKISQSSAVFLEWDPDSLLEMVNERIRAKLGAEKSWNSIDDGAVMRGSQPKWNHIVTRTFLRPRDVIQFLNYALKIALKRDHDADVFTNEDIQNARNAYSKYLSQELDDEIGPHWPCWREAVQACSAVATETLSREQFETAYEGRKTKANDLDTAQALAKLYDFSIIGYLKSVGLGGSKWIFHYSHPDAGWDSAASRLKVHQGLKEFAQLREARAGS
ncbi:hypothetical protein HFP57_12010 [Parasphingopyxis algicola]|uniref:P-loop ATPase, Sll1717 family n=1 Tax=Parasphingopyxis algicola TaxID=2026624 RepID=UPI0015A3FCDD|nr:hypothetical protein [Parasphingopyxis algicola]QLC25669.1 hypothetical protein HFP57_12010 [Parasphingopyxis algicola]